MTRILVAFQEGGTTPDNTAPGIWNHSNDGSVGTKVADLLDETGATTGISWAVGAGASFTELGSSGAFSSDHQGYAEECWETAWYANGDNDPIEFDGFAPNQTGTLKFGAWTSSGRNTRLNDGQGNTATAIAKSEPPNTVTTLNWQADGTGKLTISPEVVNNFVYVQFFDIEYTAATGLAIDSTDSTMQRGTNFELVCSNPSTAPTTANTTLSNGNDTLTPTSVTGSDPYTLTFAVGDLTKQVDATGYDWTLTVDAETATTGNIPLVIQTDYTKVDLVNPVTTNASLLFGYTGDAPVTGDDLEYDVTSVLNSGVTFGVTADGVWTITEASEGDWTTAITVDRRIVQADGTIGTEATMTFDPTTNNGGGSIQAFRPFSFTKLIKTLMEDGSYSGTGNTIIMNWLVNEGIKRTQLNEMFYKYLGNLGYTGNLNERIKQWENSAINNGFPYTIPFGLS